MNYELNVITGKMDRVGYDHKHAALYQPDETNPFVYTDNAGKLHVDGDIIQQGTTYETHAEQVLTKKDKIILRDGAISGLAPGETSGFTAEKYDGVNDGHLVFDKDGIARVGDVGTEQPLATRIETPSDKSIGFWDGTNLRFDFYTLAQLKALLSVAAINNQTGTSYTLTVVDAGKLILLGNAAAIAVTIPTNAAAAIAVGTQIDFIQVLAGKVTFGGAGVTINSKGGNKSISGQWVGASLIKTDVDTWILIGDLIA